MEQTEPIVLQPASNEENLQYMTDLSLNTPLFNPFDVEKLVFNDQGSANWYKRLYPGFPDYYYDIFELYSINGIRSKQFRSHIKKLKKKGKFKNDETTPEVVKAFEKLNVEEENKSDID